MSVYFVQPVDGGPVKIGFSDNVTRRVSQLEAHYKRPLAILATMQGGREKEREIHERFSHLRFGRTEQFRPAADLMAFIGRPLLVGAGTNVIEAKAMPMVRISEEARAKADHAARMMNVSLADYLTDLVMKNAPKDIVREARKLAGGSTD